MDRNFLNKFFCFFVWAEKSKPNSPPNSTPDKGNTSQQPIFCKFKEVFYVLFNVFEGGIIKGRLIFTVNAILIPCFIILTTAYSFQEMSKIEISNLKFFETISVNAITAPKAISVLDVNQSLREYFPKFITCGIKFFSPVSAYGETMTYQKTEQQGYERKQWIGNYFSNECYHHADLIVFFILGYLSALVIQIIWRYFFDTQLLIDEVPICFKSALLSPLFYHLFPVLSIKFLILFRIFHIIARNAHFV